MNQDIEVLYNELRNDYDKLRKEYNFCDINENDVVTIVRRIKHILDDNRAVLDYIATDISKKYPVKQRKVYFQYAKIGETKEEYSNRLNEYFSGIDDKLKQLLIKYQFMSRLRKWGINLETINNKMKHTSFSIQKISHRKVITLSSCGVIIELRGKIDIEERNGEKYITSNGDITRELISGVTYLDKDANLHIGNGTYGIKSKKIQNLEISQRTTNILTFSESNESLIGILMEIVMRTGQLIKELKEVF